MTEENKTETCEKCPLMSENFQKFTIVMLGTFFGAFFALNLMSAIKSPTVSCPVQYVPYDYRMDKGADFRYEEDIFEPEVDMERPAPVKKPEHKGHK